LGIYAKYLDSGLGADMNKLGAERKKQLERIAKLRKRDVLAYAVDVSKNKSPISINYTDLLPLSDQLSNLKADAIDIILETPGGAGETAEDIVKLLRGKYKNVGVIVPGMAKSAGTLIAMAADEILMEPVSALGPIDAQIAWQGKQFSAHALLDGMEKIKKEVIATGSLNKAYVPILQNISPGELQNAEHALDFSRDLVANWLCTYKFREWTTHSSTGQPVTADERKQRAWEIASELRDQSVWKTHGRSLKIEDLRKMRLTIIDYSTQADLADAIRRYYTLLQMTFASNVYKVFETPTSQIFRMEAVQGPVLFGPSVPGMGQVSPLPLPNGANSIEAQVGCAKCGTKFVVQARLDKNAPKLPGAIQFPANNLIKCPGNGCTEVHNLKPLRDQLQAQGRTIVS
jgi:hypothetical protein